jgi:hypothetical protein
LPREARVRLSCLVQGVASLAVPMIVIHQAVHAAQAVTKRLGRGTKWGPTIAGLALIPVLPYAVDEPCEIAIDYVFDTYWPHDEKAAMIGRRSSTSHASSVILTSKSKSPPPMPAAAAPTPAAPAAEEPAEATSWYVRLGLGGGTRKD